MADKEYIKTPDIDLASTLYAVGIPIDGVFYSGIGDKFDFYFLKNEATEKVMEDFRNRKLKVEPNLLFWSRKEIITRVKYEASSKKSD